MQRLQVGAVDAAVAAHLVNEDLGIGEEFDGFGAQLLRQTQPQEGSLVFGFVVAHGRELATFPAQKLPLRGASNGGNACVVSAGDAAVYINGEVGHWVTSRMKIKKFNFLAEVELLRVCVQ